MFSIMELFDMVIMTAVVGYIFSDMFKTHSGDLIESYYAKGFNWEHFKYAALVTAPAIILHELAHKIAAISFGFTATYHAAYFWLILGLVLKFMNFGFIFFVPAYVSIVGLMTPLQSMIISGAGPFTNLVLWLGSEALLRTSLAKKRKMHVVLYLTSKINMFLFIFNMLPIPGFDGSKFFSGLFSVF